MAQVLGVRVELEEIMEILKHKDPSFYHSLAHYIDPEDLACDPQVASQDLTQFLSYDKGSEQYYHARYYVYRALMSYQGQAFYGLTLTEDYMGRQYFGHVFSVVELSFSYKGKAPIRDSFQVCELVEEYQWTQFFLQKLGILGNRRIELHHTLHDGLFDLSVKEEV